MNKFIIVASLAALFVVGCSAEVGGPSNDPISTEQSELAGGCHSDCPKCHPGEVCPMIACVLVCQKDKCGSSVCQKGEYCCNESCGICAPEGGFCTMEVCAPTK